MKSLNSIGLAVTVLILAILALAVCVFPVGCTPKSTSEAVSDQETARLWSEASGLKPNDFAGLFKVVRGTKNEPTQRIILFFAINSWLNSDHVSTLDAIRALTDPKQKETALNLALGVLVKTDCDKMFDYIAKLSDSREKGVLLMRSFEFLEKQNLPSVLKWGKENFNGVDYPRFQEKVFSRWAILDPAEGGQALLKEAPGVSDATVRNFAREWAAVDFSSTVAWISRAPNAEIQRAGIHGVIESQGFRDAVSGVILRQKFSARLDELEVARAIATKLLAINADEGVKFLENANLSNNGALIYSVLQKWAVEMPDQALGLLVNSSTITNDTFAVDGLFSGLVVSSPGKVVGLLTTRFQPRCDSFLAAAISGWMHLNMESLKTYIAGMKGGDAGNKCVTMLCAQWGAAFPEEACKWAVGVGDSGMRLLALEQLSVYADRVSVQSTMVVLGKLPEGRVKDVWMAAMLKQYLPGQSRELLAWIEGLPESSSRKAALGALAELWAKQEPQAAMEYFMKVGDDRIRGESLKTIARTWAGANGKEAFQWASALSDEALKKSLMPAVLDGIATKDPDLAIELLSKVSDQRTYVDGVYSVSQSYARTDPQAAAKWVEAFPSEIRSGSMRVVSRAWSLSDPQAAADWIGTLSQVDKELVIPQFVTGADGSRPDLATILANEISDEGERAGRVGGVFRRWYAKDPDAALAWLPKARVSEEVREAIMRDIRKGKNW